MFDALNVELEDALARVHKCAGMSQFDKLLDQGATKRHLKHNREVLFRKCAEVKYFKMENVLNNNTFELLCNYIVIVQIIFQKYRNIVSVTY
jgi:hypothetical protein